MSHVTEIKVVSLPLSRESHEEAAQVHVSDSASLIESNVLSSAPVVVFYFIFFFFVVTVCEETICYPHHLQTCVMALYTPYKVCYLHREEEEEEEDE